MKALECYGGDVAFGDLRRLLGALGYNFRELDKRAEEIVAERTARQANEIRRLQEQIEEVKREVEFEVVWSHLFETDGRMKCFEMAKEFAARHGLKPSTVRARIAKGRMRGVRGRNIWVDLRKNEEAA